MFINYNFSNGPVMVTLLSDASNPDLTLVRRLRILTDSKNPLHLRHEDLITSCRYGSKESNFKFAAPKLSSFDAPKA